MAADPLDALRLALMQDVLPVGLAVVERARRGGPREVLAAFDGSQADPLGQLRQEGEPVASQVREGLDRLQPGLGNPVLKVEVRDVPGEPATATAAAAAATAATATAAATATFTAVASPSLPVEADPADLQATLERIAARLALLEVRLIGQTSGTQTSGTQTSGTQASSTQASGAAPSRG